VNTPTSRGDLGDEIRSRRKERKLRQPDLAKLANIATTNVGKLERGERVSATTLRAVARVLGLPAELIAPFLDESPEPTRTSRTVVTDEEQALVDVLIARDWSAVEIAKAIDALRRRKGVPLAAEQRSGTDR